MEEYPGIIFYNAFDFSEWIEQHMEDERFQVVCRFNEESHIDALFESVWEIKDCCLMVEEANLYFETHSKNEPFFRLISQGRHSEISLVCVSQRVPELPIRFRAQKNTIVTFQQQEPHDLDLLEKYGFDREEVSELVSSSGHSQLIEGTHYLVQGDPL